MTANGPRDDPVGLSLSLPPTLAAGLEAADMASVYCLLAGGARGHADQPTPSAVPPRHQHGNLEERAAHSRPRPGAGPWEARLQLGLSLFLENVGDSHTVCLINLQIGKSKAVELAQVSAPWTRQRARAHGHLRSAGVFSVFSKNCLSELVPLLGVYNY